MAKGIKTKYTLTPADLSQRAHLAQSTLKVRDLPNALRSKEDILRQAAQLEAEGMKYAARQLRSTANGLS